MSYHEQLLKMSIKDREEHIKTRISELTKEKNDDKEKEKMKLTDSVRLKKDTPTASKKTL